jgi:hypothetical protein
MLLAVQASMLCHVNSSTQKKDASWLAACYLGNVAAKANCRRWNTSARTAKAYSATKM